jgi:hypothetical chaperone protein
MTPTFCGIDFGTSNSTVALADDRDARLIALEDGAQTLPSAVFWESDGSAPQFGRAAIAAYIGGEDGRLMRGLKSTLGSSLLTDRTRVGNRALSFEDILSAFFAHLRRKLDEESGGGITRAVLGRPVHFHDDDPAADAAAEAALDRIARANGFDEVSFQFEPIAAALHYEQGISAEELVLIVDIGGGTSDFSIVRVSPDRARAQDRQGDILANDGIRVGGTDFDRLFSLAEVMPHLGLGSTFGGGKATLPRHYFIDLATWHRINMLYTGRVLSDLKTFALDVDRPDLVARLLRVIEERRGHAIAMAVEAAKIALSDAGAARLTLSPLTGGPNPVARRETFEAAVADPIARIGACVGRVLAQAGLAPSDIGSVFMTGGSSSLPILHQTVRALLPDATIATGDLLGSVGTGLALEARRRFA